MRGHAKPSTLRLPVNGDAHVSASGAGSWSRPFGVLLVVAALSLLALTSKASAATITTHPFLFSFNGASAPEGPIANPTQIAVGESDHSVYVVDLDSLTVRKFDTSGNPQDFSSLGTSVMNGANTPLGRFENLTAITVDNTGGPLDGTIYVADGFGSPRAAVIAFDPQGNFLYEFSGSDIPYQGYVGFAVITGLTVDPTGDLRIANFSVDSGDAKGGIPANTRVYKYHPTGSSASYVSDIRLDAVDEQHVEYTLDLDTDSAGRIYTTIFDPGKSVGRFVVKRLNSSGVFQSLVDTEPFSTTAFRVAVDPSNDHLYVANIIDASNLGSATGSATEFDAAGAVISRFALAGIRGQSGDLGVDGSTGNIYISDTSCGPCAGAERDVNVYGPLKSVTVPDGTSESATDLSFFGVTLHGTVNPQGVPTSYHFEYREQGEADWVGLSHPPTPMEAIEPIDGVNHDVSAPLVGLSHNTTYEYRLVAVNTNADAQSVSEVSTFTTPRVPPPLVSIDSPTQLSSSSAHLSGTVNPNERETKWRFEYSTDQTNWSKVPGPDGNSNTDDAAGSGGIAISVAAEVTNLSPNTHYFVRLVAINDLQDKAVVTSELTTESSAPLILTSPAATATVDAATLNATLIPGAPGTTYRFEYGPDASYGSSVPIPDGNAGSSGNPITVSNQISGLSADTTYHFRLIATNATGVDIGPDRTFHTSATNTLSGLPDGRVYERVSPVERAGTSVERSDFQSQDLFGKLGQVSASGDAVAWTSKGNFGGDAGSLFLTYITRRIGDRWSSTIALTPRGNQVASYQWFSEDLSTGVVPTEPLHPDDPRLEGHIESDLLYLRDTTRQNDDSNSTFSLLSKATIPLHHSVGETTGMYFGGASADLSHLAFESFLQLAANGHAQTDGNTGVYELVNGELHFVSVLPDETPAPSALIGNGLLHAYESPGDNPVSEDGSRIFFTAPIATNILGLFVRENGSETEGLSCFQAPPGGCEPAEGKFEAAKASDGSIAFFTSRESLTEGADPARTSDLYRWDATAAPGSKLSDLSASDPVAAGAGVLGTVAISRDATKVYFVADLDLAPGGEPGLPNLYLWQQNMGIRHLATLSPPEEGDSNSPDVKTWNDSLSYQRPRITADGGHLLFTSHAKLTTYETKGHQQVYLYDLASDQITCISCNRRSPASAADAYLSIAPILAQNPGGGGPTPLRNLSADGSRIFFDTKEPLLANDTNGKADVYEWSDGKLRLISTGASATDSTFMGASESGDDVFFVTGEQLVRSDRDELLDIYDARVGGIAEPNPEIPCVGDECQGAPLAPPGFSDPATSGAGEATGNVPRQPKKQHHKQKKKHHKKAQRQKQSHKTGGHGR